MQLKFLKYQLEFENSINHKLEICRFSQRKPQLLLNQMYKKAKKKGPIWTHFCQSNSDSSKAICNHCGGAYSLGSDKPKNQTTTNLKTNLKSDAGLDLFHSSLIFISNLYKYSKKTSYLQKV